MHKTLAAHPGVTGEAGGTTLSVRFDPGTGEEELFYRCSGLPSISPRAAGNTAAVALVFAAMTHGRHLHIHGECCPALLENLEEFSRIWNFWRPDRYRPVSCSCDRETPPAEPATSKTALLAFSGGVDATFSLLRHHSGANGRRNRKIAGGVLVHGTDIPLEDEPAFDRCLRSARRALEPMGIPVRAVATNHRFLLSSGGICWMDFFGTTFASALHFLSDHGCSGILASGDEYYNFRVNGSNALTDRLLSSGQFHLENDGGEFSRNEKVAYLARHPEILTSLRFCWEGALHDRNCGVCEKCIRTALNFRLAGVDPAPCFPNKVTDAMIRTVDIKNDTQYSEFRHILRDAVAAGKRNESWVRALDRRLRVYHRYGPGALSAAQAVRVRFAALRMRAGLRTRLKKTAGLGREQ
ncbi:MAG: hypothetical protein JJU00_02100 [Opitutales bacterium]|nr:hypothetical protein [Opitutales bacterium]